MRGMLRGGLSVASMMALSAAIAVPTMAVAQEASETEQAQSSQADSSELIVVTAQKREQSINEVPMSIQAASGDRLQELGIKDAGDLTKLVSGFNFNKSIYGTSVFTIRGVGFQDSTLAAGPTVTVYVDQVPLPFSALTSGVGLDVGRVEVLKGPQGTLFGQNATGGAVNYVPNQPSDQYEAGVDVSYGRFNEVDIQGYVNVPVSDTLRVRVAARRVQADGWQKEYSDLERPDAYYSTIHRQDEMGERKFINGRVLVDFTPTDRLSLKLNVSGWRDRSEQTAAQFFGIQLRGTSTVPPAGYLNFPVAPRNARAASWDPVWDYRQNNRMFFTSLRADYEVNDDTTLTSLTSYQDYKRYQPLDNDGTSYTNTYLLNTGDVKTFYQELRLEGKFAGKGSWVVGGNYENDKVFDQFYQTYADSTAKITFGLPLINNLDFSDQKVNTFGVFANAEYPVLDNVTLQAGVRYTNTKRDYQGCGADTGDGLASAVFDAISAYFRGLSGLPPLAPIPAGACFSMQSAPEFIPMLDRNSLKEDNVSWRIGVNWEPASGTLLYANVSKGYKAGSFPTLSVSVNRPQLLPVKQESILAFEAGVKTQIDTLQLSAAGFYYKYNDKQILGGAQDPVFGALEALVNVPKSRIVGIDVSAVWKPTRNLTIAPNISYIETKIQGNFVGYDYKSDIVDFTGQPFPYAPKVQANVDVEYRTDITPDHEFYIGTNISHQSHSNGYLGEYDLWRIPSYTLVDARIGVTRGAWDFSIWGRNITDKFYIQTTSRGNDSAIRYPGMPATYGVRLNYRY